MELGLFVCCPPYLGCTGSHRPRGHADGRRLFLAYQRPPGTYSSLLGLARYLSGNQSFLTGDLLGLSPHLIGQLIFHPSSHITKKKKKSDHYLILSFIIFNLLKYCAFLLLAVILNFNWFLVKMSNVICIESFFDNDLLLCLDFPNTLYFNTKNE